MKRLICNRSILAASLCLLLASGGAFAHGHGHGHGHGQHGHNPHVRSQRGYKHHRHHARSHADVRADRFDGRHDNGLHLGQHKNWARGERLPSTYLQQRYYIDDYRNYQLAPPPSGYVWVRPYQDDRQYYLVQLATGLISRIFGQ